MQSKATFIPLRPLRPLMALALFAAQADLHAATGPITLDSLIGEMTSYDGIARWPSPEFSSHQASSYDRRSISRDQGWFANDDFSGRVRVETTEGRREEVLMEDDGPGSLVRFWITTDSTKTGGGTLRIYLDENPVPVMSFPAFDLLSGGLDLPSAFAAAHPGYAPDGLGGGTMMLPVPYARHCKVTWEEKSASKRYFHINYRRYAKGTAVQSYTPEILDAARPALAKASELLLHPPAAPSSPATRASFSLLPATSTTLALPAGPAALRFIRFKLNATGDAAIDHALRSLIVKINFDKHDTVWCPASDFFGSGVGVNPMNNWYSTVEADGTMTSRWVMPYRESGRVTLENLGTGTLAGSIELSTGPWEWNERSMHFHTAWRREAGLRTPPVADWNFVRLSGRGVYAGDTLSLYNRIPTWYGEGDEKIRVDEEAFPSHFGTGTEDYYNYSFAPRLNMQTPYANLTRVDQPQTQGHNIMSRSRNLDGIPFRKSLHFDLELMSWAPTVLTYAATPRWYAIPGGTSDIAPDPAGATAPIPTLADAQAAPPAFPGVIEAEQATVTAASPGLVHETQDMQVFGVDLWSSGKQLLGRGTKAGDFLTVRIPAPDEKPHELFISLTQAPDFATLRFTVNGQASATPFDAYAPGVIHADKISLGTHAPVNGHYEIKAEVTGANPASSGKRFYFGIDGFEIR